MSPDDPVPPAILRDVLDGLSYCLAVVDEGGRIVDLNEDWRSFAATADVPLARADGSVYLDTLRESDDPHAARVAESVVTALESGTQPPTVRYPYTEGDGAHARSVRVIPIQRDGQRYAVVVHADVDEDVRAAADLRLKERAMDEAPVGITIADPDRPDYPIIYANEAFERITGYSVPEVLGRNCRFLQNDNSDESSIAEMRHAVEEEEFVSVELINERKNGEEFWNRVTIAPLFDEDGELTHYVGFQEDVTDRHETALELERERDRLALLNQVVRHDIRNDMAVALGWGETLTDQVEGERRDALERVLDAATHAKDLTTAVADIERVFAGEDPELEPTPLAPVLREEIGRVNSSFDFRAESVTIRGGDDLPDGIRVEASSLLSSVFGNLLDNAVFHNDGDHPEITVSIEEHDESVVVRIADDGPGVPDDRKREVFGRGEKGLESAGSGLGLYLVDQLVRSYGGSVWIEDNDPRGAVFCVELQRAD
ncbi:receiver/sensor box histidine kinase [Haloparvum sedimenti]|uniref:receiver/sensor box histidine kinase n=1 Tax=Haloparvum sedimenti TaxID=1678448 RepID=UPI00071E80E8|nr:PAS domain-containing protein [Haloparvum sedimenti]